MKNRICLILLAVLLATCGNPVGLFAQDVAQSKYDRIMNLIRRSNFKQAELGIDALLDVDIDDHQAHMLRKALANALVSRRRQKGAEEQYEKFLEYLVSGREQSRPLLRQLPQILMNLRYLRESQDPKATAMLDKVIEVTTNAVADEPNNEGYSMALSTAVNFKAQSLQKQGQNSELQALYRAELERLRTKWRQKPDDPETWLRLIYFMKTAASPKLPGYQAFANKLSLEGRNLISLAVERFPESTKVVDEYARQKLKEIENLRQQSPDAAMQLLNGLQKRMSEIYKRKPREMMSAKMKVDKAHQKLLRQINRDALVGILSPKIEGLAGFNGSEDILKFPPDSVTALLFISADDGLINPELAKVNDLYKKHEDKFQLVVVASDYQQSFLRLTSITKKPARDFENNQKRYRDHLQKNFVEANRLSCPMFIAADAGATANQLGIDALPFLIVIDKDGICRHVESRTIDVDKLLFTIEGLTGK